MSDISTPSAPVGVGAHHAAVSDTLEMFDPLLCPDCGSEMRIIAFIIDHQVVDQILRHLRGVRPQSERGPHEGDALEAVS